MPEQQAEHGPWTRAFLWIIHAFTWAWWIGSTLVVIASLWMHHHYGLLGFVAMVCLAYFAAARFGKPEHMGRRFVVLTLLVVVAVFVRLPL